MKPPEEIVAGLVVLRRWRQDWAADLVAAVRASLPDLQAFMAWARDDYGLDHARDFLDHADRAWAEESEFCYAVQEADNEIVGSVSLMTRLGPGVLELGYWVRSAHAGRGLATAAARALTRVALAMDGIDTVVIRHDAANIASGRVAAKAGFTEVLRRPTTLEPGRRATDVEVVWECSRLPARVPPAADRVGSPPAVWTADQPVRARSARPGSRIW